VAALSALLSDFLARGLPSPRLALVLGPPLALLAAGCAAGVAWLRARRGVRTPYTRKIFHFAIFTSAGLLQLAHGLPAVVLFGAITALVVLYAVWRGPGFAFYEALARPSDEPRRTFFILVPLLTTAAGGVLSNLLFGPVFAPIGYLVGGWGDAVGEPVGTRWGRHRYRVPSLAGVAATRSLEGSAAVFAIGAAAAALATLALGVPAGTAAAVGLACGAGGALVEAVSSHGLDNLTVQLVAAGVAWWSLG